MENAPHRHHALDLLRGLCAVGIATYHYLDQRGIAHLQSLGTFGVYVFFVLSALTMMLAYAPDFSRQIERDDLLAFYRNRAARILPLLVAVSLASFAVRGATESLPLHALEGQLALALLTGSGLFGLHLPGFLSNTTGAWSLGIEAGFYLVFPVLCLCFARASMRAVIAAIVVTLFGQQAVIALLARMAVEHPDEWWIRYTLPLTYAPFFLAGIAVWRAGRQSAPSAAPFLAACGCLTGIAVFSAATGSDVRTSTAAYLVLSALAAGAVYFSFKSRLPDRLNIIAGFLGNISYALYLTHPFALALVSTLHLPPQLDAPVFALAALTTAAAVYAGFEAPMRRRLRGRHPAHASGAAP
jgi:peptidoglycan/LPS O-acetylase OafA/YrhL